MDRVKAIAGMAAALAPGRLSRLRDLLSAVVPKPLPADVAYEIMLQSHLFFGYAQTIEAAKVFATWLGENGVEMSHPDLEGLSGDDLRHRGEDLAASVYQPNFQKLVRQLSAVSPELARWMIEDGYGKVLSRPGPTAIEREIASAVFLAISGHPVQLYSHVRGAKNLGSTAEVVLEAIAGAELGPSQVQLVAETVRQVFRK
jgi:4-carboxymuconolactone decarboxylase